MPKLATIESILIEYGLPWVVCRALYSAKLRLLNVLPVSEKLFEKRVIVKRTDIIKVDITRISAFLENISDTNKHSIIEAADNAVNGRIKAFSSLDLDYGYPVNWQLNPLTGKSCPGNVRWYRIPDFDAERGDIKLVWEASRFTHFYLFARAYMLTSDRKYYDAFSRQLDNWLQQNPYPDGANYKCGQECALRMINTLTVYSVFRNYGLTSEQDADNVAELTKRCYQKILSNFFYAHRCIKNNHTLSELCGMIIGAWCCEDDRTLDRAYRLLDKEIYSQFTPDGGYKQFSFNYQRFALQICSRVISLSETTGKSLSAISLERIRKSALLLYQCQNENGDLPNYGSNDGALIFPVTCCGYRDFRPSIGAVYTLLGGTRMYEIGLWDEEILWFGGTITGADNIQKKSYGFADAGIYTLRRHDNMAMTVLNNYCSRPAHMDQLHFDLWYKCMNVFCDGGTYSYASTLGNELMCTESHNTVKCGDVEQMNKISSFMLCNWSKLSKIFKTDTVFEGKMTSRNGYSHKRRVELIDNGYLLTDTVIGIKSFEVLFHTPLFTSISDGIVTLSDGSKPVCTLEVDGCHAYLTEGHRSLYYMRDESISVIHIASLSPNSRSIKIKIRFREKD